MASGFICITLSVALLCYNTYENRKAQQFSDAIMEVLRIMVENEKLQNQRPDPFDDAMTEKEIDEQLTEHFSKHPILTRRDFEFLCMQVKSTACRILRKLVEAGKLKNISTPRNPVYVPDNGHYASVAGE